jgi:hypothetical protein
MPRPGHAGTAGESSSRCRQCGQTPSAVPLTRPEQQKSGHDRLDLFDASKAPPSSTAFEHQPNKGQIRGFDFYRDPLNAKQPMQTFEEIMQADIAQQGQVMAAQRQLLERRYNLTPQVDSQVTMSRSKPVPIGQPPSSHRA